MLAVLFSLGSRRHGLDSAAVERIVPALPLQPVAGAPRPVAGSFSYRGQTVPVIDLTRLSGGAPARAHLSTRIILVNYPEVAGGTRLLGLLAEQVTEVRGVAGLSSSRKGPTGPEEVRVVSLSELVPEDLLAGLWGGLAGGGCLPRLCRPSCANVFAPVTASIRRRSARRRCARRGPAVLRRRRPGPRRNLNGCWRILAPEFEALVEEMLVPESWLFRDGAPYAFLEKWAREKWRPTAAGRVLRVLSVPCASGQEPWLRWHDDAYRRGSAAGTISGECWRPEPAGAGPGADGGLS